MTKRRIVRRDRHDLEGTDWNTSTSKSTTAAAPTKHTRKRMTTRKVRNRGWTPIRYRTADEVRHGWIVKRGRKLLHIHLIGIGNRRVPLEEERYMTEVTNAKRDSENKKREHYQRVYLDECLPGAHSIKEALLKFAEKVGITGQHPEKAARNRLNPVFPKGIPKPK